MEENGKLVSASEHALFERKELDHVTKIQENIDSLALSMFESLRSIPELKADENIEVAINVKDHAWISKVKELSRNIISEARSLQGLINSLPGADITEDEQMEEIDRLSKESLRLNETLRLKVSEAEARISINDQVLNSIFASFIDS